MEKICKSSFVQEGSMKGFTVNDTAILIAKVEGKFYAMDAICSHYKGYLAAGTLKGYTVICPVHGAEFDVRTGEVTKNISPMMEMATHKKASKMKTYKVTEKTGYLYADI